MSNENIERKSLPEEFPAPEIDWFLRQQVGTANSRKGLGVSLKILLAALVAMTAGSAIAQGFETTKLAIELSAIIGSADACELEIDTDAVAAFIEKEVPAEDMGFIGELNLMTDGTRYNVGEMGELQRKIHCMQVRRAAKANGLAKE